MHSFLKSKKDNIDDVLVEFKFENTGQNLIDYTQIQSGGEGKGPHEGKLTGNNELSKKYNLSSATCSIFADKKESMTLPILTYGDPVLREIGKPVLKEDTKLNELITDMWDTLRVADGCGLAAPQVGHALRVFIVNSRDTFQSMDRQQRVKYFDGDSGIEETFINAEIIRYDEEDLRTDGEGCLSIPGLQEAVKRPWSITVRYLDSGFNEHVRVFSGYTARVIQHEYDHTQGILYIDRLDKLRRNLISNRLKQIRNGKVKTVYPMRKVNKK